MFPLVEGELHFDCQSPTFILSEWKRLLKKKTPLLDIALEDPDILPLYIWDSGLCIFQIRTETMLWNTICFLCICYLCFAKKVNRLIVLAPLYVLLVSDIYILSNTFSVYSAISFNCCDKSRITCTSKRIELP